MQAWSTLSRWHSSFSDCPIVFARGARYQTVFFWEYLGPLVIYMLVYLLPSTIVYGASATPAPS